jgi:streptomycin 6-kinase
MFSVSPQLRWHCQKSPERMAWLERLPATIAEIADRWHLEVCKPFEGGGEASWVAPASCEDGSRAVLKLGLPHMEAESEAEGLRTWSGDPTVRLLEADDSLGAMLIERCEPGTSLRERPEPEQDVVLAPLLRRLWRAPVSGHAFRPLSRLIDYWRSETLTREAEWGDAALVRSGLDALQDMAGDVPGATLLATDLHAGNVLRAEREPWLVIDPKPFVGDPAYDATQHLLNCHGRMSADPQGTIARFAGLLDVDAERVRRWVFARAAAGPRDDWRGTRWFGVARAIAPGT